MLLSKEQLSSVMAKHSERENGLHDLIQFKNPPPLVVVMFFGAMPKFDNFAK